MADKFRRIRKTDSKPCSHAVICKHCENVATMVLAEFQYLAREGETIPRESSKYQLLLESLFIINGFLKLPRDSDGKIKDVLRYQLRFCRVDGTPLVPSAVRIRQIKLNAGFMDKGETVATR